MTNYIIGRKQWNRAFYYSLVVIFLLFLPFYQKILYLWDHPDHLNVARTLLSGKFSYETTAYLHIYTYPLYHFCVRILSILLGGRYGVAGALVLSGANIAAILTLRQLLTQLFPVQGETALRRIDLICCFSIFFETLPSPLTQWRIYAYQCSANPWHNPTITFVRPFGLLAFYFFILLFTQFRQNQPGTRPLCLFSLFAAVSAIAKPSYVMVLMPAAGLFTLVYWVQDLKNRFAHAMKLLAAAIPTILIVAIQFCVCQFGRDGTVSPVRFSLGSYANFSTPQIFAVSLSAFPVPILACFLYRKNLFVSDTVKLSFLTLMAGWIEMFCFTNGHTGDFSWGYMLSIHLCTATCLGYALVHREKQKENLLLTAVFVLQVLVGLYYIVQVYRTCDYWF